MSRREDFQQEFAALLTKYKANFTVRESWCGYAMVVDGITVDFDGIQGREDEHWDQPEDIHYGTGIHHES